MKIGSKIYWLLLIIMFAAVILCPGYVLGQTEQKDRDLVIRFSPGSYPYNVRIGEDNLFYLEIENTGIQDITNIRLYANTPEGWVVEINPETVSLLPAGRIQTISANVQPAATASKRDYQITFVAEGDEIQRVLTAWVRVENSEPVWLWVGFGLGVIVIAGFVFVFMRIGRK